MFRGREAPPTRCTLRLFDDGLPIHGEGSTLFDVDYRVHHIDVLASQTKNLSPAKLTPCREGNNKS
jgi:hypothetical protein